MIGHVMIAFNVRSTHIPPLNKSTFKNFQAVTTSQRKLALDHAVTFSTISYGKITGVVSRQFFSVTFVVARKYQESGVFLSE